MARIETRENADGSKRYRVKWRQDGRAQSELFTRSADAVRFRGMVDAAGQRWPVDEHGSEWVRGFGFPEFMVPLEADPLMSLTVADQCRRSIDTRSAISPQTRAEYRWSLKHLGPLEHILIADLKRSDVSAWINSLQLHPKTIANLHGLVSSCIADAVADGLLERNPCAGLRLPERHGPGGSAEIIALTPAEIDLIAGCADAHYRPLIRTLEGTGARQGEIFALQVRHVDLAGPRISIVQAVRRQPGGAVIAAPKTRKSIRTISITAELAQLLAPLVEGRPLDARVFTNPTGSNIHAQRFRADVWAPAVRSARRCDDHKDAARPCGCPGTLTISPRIHDLRHSHVSLLIDAGVPLAKISRRLGHESILTTVNTYGHMLKDSDDEVIEALRRPAQSPV